MDDRSDDETRQLDPEWVITDTPSLQSGAPA